MKSKSLSRMGFEKNEKGQIVRKAGTTSKVVRKNYKPKAKQTGTPDFITVNSRDVECRPNGFKVRVKAISVNDAFTGRRFKTPYYEQYTKVMLELMPDIVIPAPPFKILIRVGFSNTLSDCSNIIKNLEDICQERYQFNDRDVFDIRAVKEIVKKGQEYIDLSIGTYDPAEEIIF